MRDRISSRPRSMGTEKGRDDAGGSSSCGPAVTTAGPASINQSAQRFDGAPSLPTRRASEGPGDDPRWRFGLVSAAASAGVVYAFVPRSRLERAPISDALKKIRIGHVPGKKAAGPADRIAGSGTGSHRGARRYV